MAKALYFNRVQRAPHWYTPSGVLTVVEVKYGMRTGLQLQLISATNALPLACARAEATKKKTMKVSPLDHDVIMKEANKCNRLEYNNNDDDDDESKEESKEESE